MRRWIFAVTLIFLTSVVLTYNACINSQNIQFVKAQGTVVTNPFAPASWQVMLAACTTINRCQPAASISKCQDALLAAPINTQVGLPATYTSFLKVVEAEQAGSLRVDSNDLNACSTSVASLDCSDPAVVAAYDSSNSDPFSQAYKVIPDQGQLCNGVFTENTSTIQYVQSDMNGCSACSQPYMNFPSPNQAGNLIVVVMTSNQAPTSIQDSLGNNYVQAVSPISNGSWSSYLWYASNIKGGNNTLTVNFPGNASSEIAVAEYSGAVLTGALDTASSATGNSNVFTCPAVTTSASGDLLFSYAYAFSGVAGFTAGSGFTLRNNDYQWAAFEDQLAGAPGSYGSSMNYGASTNWTCMLASFKSR